MNGVNYYQVLGVSAKESKENIVKAFIKLAKEMLPEKHHDDDEAMAKYQKIVSAYRILCYQMERILHDLCLSIEEFDQSILEDEKRREEDKHKIIDPEAEYYANWSPDPSAASANIRSTKPITIPGKPCPGAYRYTEEGVPVGKEEESRPQNADKEWDKWEKILASGPPPLKEPDYISRWREVNLPDWP